MRSLGSSRVLESTKVTPPKQRRRAFKELIINAIREVVWDVHSIDEIHGRRKVQPLANSSRALTYMFEQEKMTGNNLTGARTF